MGSVHMVKIALVVALVFIVVDTLVLCIGWKLAKYRRTHHTGTPPEIGSGHLTIVCDPRTHGVQCGRGCYTPEKDT